MQGRRESEGVVESRRLVHEPEFELRHARELVAVARREPIRPDEVEVREDEGDDLVRVRDPASVARTVMPNVAKSGCDTPGPALRPSAQPLSLRAERRLPPPSWPTRCEMRATGFAR